MKWNVKGARDGITNFTGYEVEKREKDICINANQLNQLLFLRNFLLPFLFETLEDKFFIYA